MTITNFTFTVHENGNVIFAEDGDTVFKAIQVVTQALIGASDKSAKFASDFSGNTTIPAAAPINSFLYIDASGNLNVITKTTFDNNVSAAAASAVAANNSAIAAAASAVDADASEAGAIAAAASAVAAVTFASQTGISAAGTNQATATALTTSDNFKLFEITSVAAGAGVKLPASAASHRLVIVNRSFNPLKVYPASGGTADAGGANVPTVIAGESSVLFCAKDVLNNWFSTNPISTTGAARFSNASGEQVRISSGGNVLIGTVIDFGYKLHVSGTTNITGICTMNGVAHDVQAVNGIGSIRLLYNGTGTAIPSGGTAAGASLCNMKFNIATDTFDADTVVVGTWKNITGITCAIANAVDFVRIA